MLPRKPRHLLYAILLVLLSLIFGSAMAKSLVRNVVSDISTAIKSINSVVVSKNASEEANSCTETAIYSPEETEMEALAPPMMFPTIINGYDKEETCLNDGTPMAKFFLWGTGDDRTITVNGSGTV